MAPYQVFFRWLKDNGLYQQWVDGHKKWGLEPEGFKRLTWAKMRDALNSTAYSFVWYASKEGQSFWADINMKWFYYCRSKNFFSDF